MVGVLGGWEEVWVEMVSNSDEVGHRERDVELRRGKLELRCGDPGVEVHGTNR